MYIPTLGSYHTYPTMSHRTPSKAQRKKQFVLLFLFFSIVLFGPFVRKKTLGLMYIVGTYLQHLDASQGVTRQAEFLGFCPRVDPAARPKPRGHHFAKLALFFTTFLFLFELGACGVVSGCSSENGNTH